MTDIDALCADYLSRLDTALSDRSVPQRRQIVEQVTEHLNEARGELSIQSEVAVRSILERLGSPADATGSLPSAPWFTHGRRILVLALGVVLVAAGLTVGLLESNGHTPSRTNSGTATTATTMLGGAAATVTVPVVDGETISQATVAIQSAGLTIQGIAGDPNGLVNSEEPSGGSQVAAGSEVTLHAQPTSTNP
jgi:hypothetical protein